MAAVAYLDRRLRAADLPGVAVAQPVVGELDLPAVVDLLVEHAELVADAVTHGGELRGLRANRDNMLRGGPGHRYPGRLGLLLDEVIEIEVELGCGRTDGVVQAEVEQIVGEMRAHEEFRGEIVDGAHVVLRVVLPWW